VDDLPRIWQAQTESLKIPNTGMAVISDIGNIEDIHPRNKRDVGKRLALWALAKDYGRNDTVFSGPIYKSMRIVGDKIEISFDYVGDGLATRDGKEPDWFEIAGEDKQFHPAKAQIAGNRIIVSSDKVASPTAVRFAWGNIAEPNLMNKNGLPASSFRTDN
jgi:sialate O-acetylesterase